MARTCIFIILAAGEGTRMRSSLPKALHRIAGQPMLLHVLETAAKSGADKVALVVGAGAGEVADAARAKLASVDIVEQRERQGTAHAVLAARGALEAGFDDVVISFVDTPLVGADTIQAMRQGLARGDDVVVLGFHTDRPHGYGRLIEGDGRLLAIREERDASEDERKIGYCNAGMMAIGGANIVSDLQAIGNDNAKSEFYLTDVVDIVRSRGGNASAVEVPEPEVVGINTRADLAAAESAWQSRRRRELLLEGVTMQAPDTVYLNYDTIIGADCELEPNVFFGAGVELEAGVTVRAFSHLEGCQVASGAVVGPFARIRPGTLLGEGVRIGNFCEIKNASVGPGAKINHLSYVGDARVGLGANIGAGTITCNYDGYGKYRTEIGDKAFIGSNSSLVAPVRIGDGAYIASGSVIVEDVPADALGIARSRQSVKTDYAVKIAERAQKKRSSR